MRSPVSESGLESYAPLVRPGIASLLAYSSARNECERVDDILFLDANESPFSGNSGPNGAEDNRYPDPQPLALLEELALFYGVRAEQILITRGVDEGIDTLMRVFCEPRQDNIVIHPPTYGFYEVSSNIQGAAVKYAPLRANFQLDTERILAEVDERTKILMICNPNNPTGNILRREDIHFLLQALQDRCLVVLDEAYIEFSAHESFVNELQHYPHMIVLRTFSKAWGLAGLRLGVVLAHPGLITVMRKVLAPYPINRPAIEGLTKLLASQGSHAMRERVLYLSALRDGLIRELKKIRAIQTVYPSATNFILLKVDRPTRLVAELKAAGIRIRDRSSEISGCVRITVGSESDNATLLLNLRNLLS
jgi:histidinol-phosphate aminotransferase